MSNRVAREQITDEMVEAAEVAIYGRHERGFIMRPLVGAVDMRAAISAALSAQAVPAEPVSIREKVPGLPSDAELQTLAKQVGMTFVPHASPQTPQPETMAEILAEQAKVNTLRPTYPVPATVEALEEMVEIAARNILRADGIIWIEMDDEWKADVDRYRAMCAKWPEYATTVRGQLPDAFRAARAALRSLAMEKE